MRDIKKAGIRQKTCMGENYCLGWLLTQEKWSRLILKIGEAPAATQAMRTSGLPAFRRY
jgi:hypothetical protein